MEYSQALMVAIASTLAKVMSWVETAKEIQAVNAVGGHVSPEVMAKARKHARDAQALLDATD